jgi:hypothetical protein
MCGGIRFAYDPALEPALAELFTAEQVAQARNSGVVETVFWQAHPVLPAIIDGKLRLYDWGNRDEQVRLPKTGWMRQESLAAGNVYSYSLFSALSLSFCSLVCNNLV